MAALGVATVAVALLCFVALENNQHSPTSAANPARMYTAPRDELLPKKPVVVIGDSYAAGTGSSSHTSAWVAVVAGTKNWEVTNLARGGTGFSNTVSGDKALVACGLGYCPSFLEMLKSVSAVSPEIVVVSGGRNDSKVAQNVETSQIKQFFQELRASVPNALIIATNALWDDDAPPAAIAEISSAIQVSATEVGATFVDIGQPLQGDPSLISIDGVHPNNKGHSQIAGAIVAALASS